MNIRNVRPSDYPPIITMLDDWWGGRKMSAMLPRLFFEHFCDTSFIIEGDEKIVAFLIGFLSQSRSDEAYIHFVGVHPLPHTVGSNNADMDVFYMSVFLTLCNRTNVLWSVVSPRPLTQSRLHFTPAWVSKSRLGRL